MNCTAKRTRLPAVVPAVALALALFVALSGGFAPAAQAAAPYAAALAPTVSDAGQRYTVEIRPQLELMAGVLLVTGRHESWEQLPEDGGTQYLKELKAFLEPFADHQAMQLVNRLYDAGMHTDRFATFAMHLGQIPDLDLKYPYSMDFFDESDVPDLETLRAALQDLAVVSHFDEFLVKWQPSYRVWVNGVADRFDGDQVIGWLEDFFGETRANYRLVLAPGLPYGCGLGPWLTGPDGTTTFDIVQDAGYSSAEPEFGDQYQLESLAAHEWGHSYVNPVIADNGGDVGAFDRFYAHVESSLSDIGYDSLQAYADEQVLRAVVCVAIEDIYGPDRAAAEIQSETDQGFRLTQTLSDMFGTYRGDRATYPRFSSYAPTMLSNIARQPDPENTQQFAAAVIVVGLLVYALVRLANSGRRPPRAATPGQPITAAPPAASKAAPCQPASDAGSEGAAGVGAAVTVGERSGTAAGCVGDARVRLVSAEDEQTFVHLCRGLTLFECAHRAPGFDFDATMAERIDAATRTFRDGDEKRLILLAERDGVAIGYVLARLALAESRLVGRIDELFVDEGARGTGAGTTLLNAAAAWLTERGAKSLRLEVPDWNIEAKRFFARAGFLARLVAFQRGEE